MISAIRNSYIQNSLNKRIFLFYLEHLRCISMTSVNNFCSLMKNETSLKPLGLYNTKSTMRQQVIMKYFTSSSAVKPEDKAHAFNSYFPGIVQELKEKAENYTTFGVGDHFKRALEYNVQGGKKLRGISLMQSYELLVPKDMRPERNSKLAGYLGWCIEMLHVVFLILDDIMDRSITRRAKPCWYKLEDIQASAINDSIMIYSGIYQILKEHFSHMDCYTELVDLFHETAFTMILGQVLDTKSQKQDVLSFTMEQYKTSAIYKSFYGHLSIACALHLAGYTSPEIFQQAKEIFTEIGYLFQTQDDFMDCFGDSSETGKIGTDIPDGTCTWLSAMCVQRSTDAQKKIMKENFGKDDTEAVARIKQLYKELSLPDIYATYEEDAYNTIKMQIQQISQKIPDEIFLILLDKLYRRKA